jgi:hypothetical protein
MKLRTLALPLLFVGGCKMSAPATASPDAHWGGEAAVDATAMPGSAESAPAPPMEAEEMDESGGGRWKRDRAARSEVASPAPAQAPRGNASAGDKAEQAVEKQPQDDLDGRHIVYTAQMMISVFNLEDAMTKAEAIPETYGGYIQSMSAGNLVLRVPSKSLRKVMDELADYGVVDQRALQAADVTAEFTDIDSRIRALTETQKQLLELLQKARTVQEALEVRQALDGINSELEVLKGRMRQLENIISYSTLTLTLYERGPNTPTPSSNDPFPWVNELGVESTEWK